MHLQNAFQFSVESACKICRYSILIIRGVILKVAKMIKTQCVVVRGNLNALRYSNEMLTPVCIPHLRNNGRMRLMQIQIQIFISLSPHLHGNMRHMQYIYETEA